MSERVRNWITIALIAVMAVALAVLVLTDPTDADRVQSIGSKIKCPVCQGESIANSPAQMAQDMLALVGARVDEGRSDDEIIDELLSSFSGAVLLDPPVSGSTLWLWVAPGIAILLGVAVIASWRRPTDSTEVKPPPRTLPIIGLAVAFAVIAVGAALSLQDNPTPASGVAGMEIEELDDVSNETMEAVIAANADNPQINGMRLALAERYYELGDYRSAFPHYLQVAESDIATDDEVVAALVRLGWMAWDGNGEVDAAVSLFDEALAIDAKSTTALYLKGQVLWCGASDFDSAAELFGDVLSDSSLQDDSRDLVQQDLDAVMAGIACT